MLEQIREKSQGVTAKVILGLIILTFAVAGVGSYSNSVDTSVATVNGEDITQQAFNQAYQSQRARMSQQFGEMFDTLSNDAAYMANFRQGVLDNLISEKLIDQSSEDLAIIVSDKRLKETIREMPEFQVDGVFDNNRYLAIINQSGFFQSSDFRDYIRVEMTRRQLSQALVGSEFNLPYQEKLQLALQNQTRNIRYATIAAEQFKSGIELTDDEINNYYLANQTRFENKEQVKVNYISLNVADIAQEITISDEEVAKYYQENLANFTDPEQRRISHILIEFNEDDTESAKMQAQSVLDRLEQGEDFAALAKELSNDTFSGDNGGDLEWLDPGVMEESFDAAALALVNVGDTSGLVETSFGYHVLKLTDYKKDVVKTLAEVESDLRARLSDEQAQNKFFALQQEMARLSFEFPDSLEDAAAEVNVEIQTSPWLLRAGNVAPFNQQNVIDAAFSDLVLQENMNSDLIEISDDLVVVLRLNEFKEANIKPLSEVEAQIKDILVNQKSTELAQQTVDLLLADFKSGVDIEEQLSALNANFVSEEEITRYSPTIDQSISRAAFVLPHPVNGAVSASSVALSNGDLALVEVTGVAVNDAPAAPNLAQQQTAQLAQSAYQSFVNSLKAEAKITRKEIAEPTPVY
ncbi:SurA N-terminal domain-containing protein [Colwellia sp. E2M01]|uniref:SurA N-terminal domain-containing protein n=1 Tax=Colwellia sp. E2M01 TaxID=2841561 RepID=UPI001C07F028|nr:SurA N-terminal domain-containing protein [Colwellia sp. E2M01]MBU2872315.1 SurA N-terminal domain-containing protein [Colwellia sp. E2M01]